MSSDQPQDAPQPQDARRGEHVEIVEQEMDAEPAPPRVSRRTRLRRAVTARRPTRALLRPAALVAAGLIAGILLTLGVGALVDDRHPGRGAGVADGRGGWHGGDGPGDRDRDRDGADGSTDSDDDATTPEPTTPDTTSPTTGPTPSGTA